MRALLVLLAAMVGATTLTLVAHALALVWPGVIVIATPAAHVVSWITGWPMMQESGLLCVVLGFYFTTTLTGAALGATAALVTTGRGGRRGRRARAASRPSAATPDPEPDRASRAPT